MRSKTVAKLVLALFTSLLILGLFEVALRVAVPRHLFMDPQSDAYWKLRFQDFAKRLQARGGSARMALTHDPQLGWRMKPDFEKDGISHDARGLRRTGSPERASAATRRIVALGDSFTYGLGVRDDETYASQLEELLPDTDVVNLGANGYGTDQQLLMWQQEGVRLEPGVVLLGFYLPDFHRNGLGFREFAKPYFAIEGDELRLRGVPVPPIESLLESPPRVDAPLLRTVEALKGLWQRSARRFGASSESERFLAKAELLEALFQALRRSTDAQGAKLAIVLIPHADYRAYPQSDEIAEVATRSARALDIPLVDLRSVLEEADTGDLYAANAHWTPRGHELAARHILEFLREQGLVDTGS